MKIVIELDDHDLRRAIDQQLAKVISGLGTEHITKEIDRVLGVKFNRITEGGVRESVQAAADQAVGKVISRGYNDSIIRDALAKAALEVIKARAF